MSQPMPYSNFQWYNDCSTIDLNAFPNWLHSIPVDSDIGYILEVDLQYTDKISTARFPLAPEKKKPDINLMSSYQQDVINTKHKAIGELLINDLTDKNNYVVHYRNLQFYLKHGMTVTRVNRTSREGGFGASHRPQWSGFGCPDALNHHGSAEL